MKAVAIDGPSGAGKSTIARAIAKALGFIYVDTGALYRAVGLYVLRDGKTPSNPDQVIPMLSKIDVQMKYIDGEQKIILNGEDVSQVIRQPEMSMAASDVSAIPKVREFLFDLQQSIAHSNNVIMDGRDIGTVVLPNADVKIFLTATPEDRAKRRFDEFKNKEIDVDFDELLCEIKQRDYNDSNRDIAPLKKADDAILVDTTGNELTKSIEILTNIVKENLK